MQSVGLSLYNAFENLTGRKVFKQIEKEALIIKRNVEFFSMDHVTAIERLGRMHSSEKFRTLLLGYTSMLRGGGDLTRYLGEKLREYLVDLRFKWQRFSETVGEIGESMIALFFVLSALLLAVSLVFPRGATPLIGMVTMLAIPTLIVVIYVLIVFSQLKKYDVITGIPF